MAFKKDEDDRSVVIEPEYDGIVMLSPDVFLFNDAHPRPDGRKIYHIFEQYSDNDDGEDKFSEISAEEFSGKQNDYLSKAYECSFENIQQNLAKYGISLEEWFQAEQISISHQIAESPLSPPSSSYQNGFYLPPSPLKILKVQTNDNQKPSPSDLQAQLASLPSSILVRSIKLEDNDEQPLNLKAPSPDVKDFKVPKRVKKVRCKKQKSKLPSSSEPVEKYQANCPLTRRTNTMSNIKSPLNLNYVPRVRDKRDKLSALVKQKPLLSIEEEIKKIISQHQFSPDKLAETPEKEPGSGSKDHSSEALRKFLLKGSNKDTTEKHHDSHSKSKYSPRRNLFNEEEELSAKREDGISCSNLSNTEYINGIPTSNRISKKEERFSDERSCSIVTEGQSSVSEDHMHFCSPPRSNCSSDEREQGSLSKWIQSIKNREASSSQKYIPTKKKDSGVPASPINQRRKSASSLQQNMYSIEKKENVPTNTDQNINVVPLNLSRSAEINNYACQEDCHIFPNSQGIESKGIGCHGNGYLMDVAEVPLTANAHPSNEVYHTVNTQNNSEVLPQFQEWISKDNYHRINGDFQESSDVQISVDASSVNTIQNSCNFSSEYKDGHVKEREQNIADIRTVNTLQNSSYRCTEDQCEDNGDRNREQVIVESHNPHLDFNTYCTLDQVNNNNKILSVINTSFACNSDYSHEVTCTSTNSFYTSEDSSIASLNQTNILKRNEDFESRNSYREITTCVRELGPLKDTFHGNSRQQEHTRNVAHPCEQNFLNVCAGERNIVAPLGSAAIMELENISNSEGISCNVTDKGPENERELGPCRNIPETENDFSKSEEIYQQRIIDFTIPTSENIPQSLNTLCIRGLQDTSSEKAKDIYESAKESFRNCAKDTCNSDFTSEGYKNAKKMDKEQNDDDDDKVSLKKNYKLIVSRNECNIVPAEEDEILSENILDCNRNSLYEREEFVSLERNEKDETICHQEESGVVHEMEVIESKESRQIFSMKLVDGKYSDNLLADDKDDLSQNTGIGSLQEMNEENLVTISETVVVSKEILSETQNYSKEEIREQAISPTGVKEHKSPIENISDEPKLTMADINEESKSPMETISEEPKSPEYVFEESESLMDDIEEDSKSPMETIFEMQKFPIEDVMEGQKPQIKAIIEEPKSLLETLSDEPKSQVEEIIAEPKSPLVDTSETEKSSEEILFRELKPLTENIESTLIESTKSLIEVLPVDPKTLNKVRPEEYNFLNEDLFGPEGSKSQNVQGGKTEEERSPVEIETEQGLLVSTEGIKNNSTRENEITSIESLGETSNAKYDPAKTENMEQVINEVANSLLNFCYMNTIQNLNENVDPTINAEEENVLAEEYVELETEKDSASVKVISDSTENSQFETDEVREISSKAYLPGTDEVKEVAAEVFLTQTETDVLNDQKEMAEQIEENTNEILNIPMEVKSIIKVEDEQSLDSKSDEVKLSSSNDIKSTSKRSAKQKLTKGKNIKTMINIRVKVEKLSESSPLRCLECDYIGRTVSLLKRHMLSHLAVKKFSCTKCNYSTNFNSYLEEHKVTHSDKRPFKCSFCTFASKLKSNLKKHERTHQKFKCPDCKFVTKGMDTNSCCRCGYVREMTKIQKPPRIKQEEAKSRENNKGGKKKRGTRTVNMKEDEKEKKPKRVKKPESQSLNNEENVVKMPQIPELNNCSNVGTRKRTSRRMREKNIQRKQSNKTLGVLDTFCEESEQMNVNNIKQEVNEARENSEVAELNENIVKVQKIICTRSLNAKNLVINNLEKKKKVLNTVDETEFVSTVDDVKAAEKPKDLKLKLLKCPKCNFETYSARKLTNHRFRHSDTNKLKCSKCDYSCTTKRVLLIHENEKHRDTLNKDNEGESLDTKKELSLNEFNESNAVTNELKGLGENSGYEVDNVVSSNNSIQNEVNGVHNNNKLSRQNMRKRRKHGGNTLKNLIQATNNSLVFKCSECTYKTCDKNLLTRHAFVHSKKKLVCSQCDFIFSTKSQLDTHQSAHSKLDRPGTIEKKLKKRKERNAISVEEDSSGEAKSSGDKQSYNELKLNSSNGGTNCCSNEEPSTIERNDLTQEEGSYCQKEPTVKEREELVTQEKGSHCQNKLIVKEREELVVIECSDPTNLNESVMKIASSILIEENKEGNAYDIINNVPENSFILTRKRKRIKEDKQSSKHVKTCLKTNKKSTNSELETEEHIDYPIGPNSRDLNKSTRQDGDLNESLIKLLDAEINLGDLSELSKSDDGILITNQLKILPDDNLNHFSEVRNHLERELKNDSNFSHIDDIFDSFENSSEQSLWFPNVKSDETESKNISDSNFNSSSCNSKEGTGNIHQNGLASTAVMKRSESLFLSDTNTSNTNANDTKTSDTKTKFDPCDLGTNIEEKETIQKPNVRRSERRRKRTYSYQMEVNKKIEIELRNLEKLCHQSHLQLTPNGLEYDVIPDKGAKDCEIDKISDQDSSDTKGALLLPSDAFFINNSDEASDHQVVKCDTSNGATINSNNYSDYESKHSEEQVQTENRVKRTKTDSESVYSLLDSQSDSRGYVMADLSLSSVGNLIESTTDAAEIVVSTEGSYIVSKNDASISEMISLVKEGSSTSNVIWKNEAPIQKVESLFQCSRCNYSTNMKQFLEKHEHSHKELECLECKLEADSVQMLQNHTAEKPEEEAGTSKIRNFKCPDCGYIAPTKTNLKGHTFMHLSQKSSTKNVSKSSLKSELVPEVKDLKEKSEPIEAAKLLCKICEITFCSKSSLKRHMNNKHKDLGVNSAENMDEEREKINKSNVERTKEAERRVRRPSFVSQISKKRQSPVKNMRVQKQSRAPKIISTNKRKLVKKKTTKKPPVLTKNQSKSEQKKSPVLTKNQSKSEQKKYKCSSCNFSSDSKEYLDSHAQLHRSDKRLKCPKCAYATNRRSNLKQHSMSHLACKRLKCSQCDYRTNFHRCIKNHMMKMHQNVIV